VKSIAVFSIVAAVLLNHNIGHAQTRGSGMGLPGGYGAGAAGDALAAQNAAQKLMIFGGENHDVYLGCMSCPPWEADSVHNTVGKYGSVISPTSISNSISAYGNAISPTSACNELATAPPVLVDRKGKYYGELTLNALRTKRTTIRAANAWLDLVCSGKSPN
jgi:hypothetical protein